MADETEFLEKPTEAEPTNETVKTQTTTATTTTGAPKPSESMWAGMSGRFWIAMVLVVGLVLATLFLLAAVIFGKFPTDAAVITVIAGIFTAYLGTATTIAGMYFGQGQKPKSQQ